MFFCHSRPAPHGKLAICRSCNLTVMFLASGTTKWPSSAKFNPLMKFPTLRHWIPVLESNLTRCLFRAIFLFPVPKRLHQYRQRTLCGQDPDTHRYILISSKLNAEHEMPTSFSGCSYLVLQAKYDVFDKQGYARILLSIYANKSHRSYMYNVQYICELRSSM